MAQLSLPLVFTRNSVPGVPRKSFLRDVCALRSCERLLLAESLVTGSTHLPPLSCNKWRKDGPIIFATVFTRNSVPSIPRKSFLRGVCALRSCERLLLAESWFTGSAHLPPLSCNKWKKDGPLIFATCFYTQLSSWHTEEILSSRHWCAPFVRTIAVGRI